MATHYDPRIIGADRWQATPNPRAMAHRTSDLIRGLDPETYGAILPRPQRCSICGVGAYHSRTLLRDHYRYEHGLETSA